ncbi:hypothetical protein BN2364_0554 [Alloalcanivorax xenomutans]|nr:hypothetical protein BN2364_0554 [Alloalcanivorax xenomutans]
MHHTPNAVPEPDPGLPAARKGGIGNRHQAIFLEQPGNDTETR